MMKRVLFLFNHDAAHQAAHIAGIAGALAQRDTVHVTMAYGTPAIRRAVAAMLPHDALAAMEHDVLDMPGIVDTSLGVIDRVAPIRRVARLHYNVEMFASADIVVSTERTCLRVKRRLGSRAPRFVYVPHGSGDRNVAYHAELAQFDLMLLSGRKLVDNMVSRGLADAQACRIIGYPKFDTVDLTAGRSFFDNANPVFLYNPHFDPHLSSWYDMGRGVIEFFANHADAYNLIVAPHVMLFRKKLHYSLEYRRARIRPEIPVGLPGNILVDLQSERLFDMSYTLSADAYIGDVSSQVYEFLVHRGACFFLDPQNHGRGGTRDEYEFWRNGDVCITVETLASLVPRWRERGDLYRPIQNALFDYTFDVDPARSALERGADAISDYALTL